MNANACMNEYTTSVATNNKRSDTRREKKLVKENKIQKKDIENQKSGT